MESFLSIVAIMISIFALVISVRESYLNDKPYIRLESIKFVPSEFFCYSNCCKEGYEELSQDNINIIKNNRYKSSMQNIGGKRYLVFNLLDEKSDMENVRLILAPMICICSNTGAICNEFTFEKGHTKIRDDANRIHKYNIVGKVFPQGDKIEIKMAYVCKEGQSTSLFYERLNDIKDEFDYLIDKLQKR